MVIVKFTDNNTVVYQEQPEIFTTFEKGSEKFNGKSHYMSLNGKYALAYVECGLWMIQDQSVR